MDDHLRDAEMATRAIRVGQRQDVSSQHSEPLVLTSSYFFDDAADAAEKFAGRRAGNVYIRFDNPTVKAFEERLASMEQAEAAVATGSGMSLYMLMAMALLQAGDHVVLGKGMFGTTGYMFNNYYAKFGVTASVVDVADHAGWQRSITPTTRMIIVETPTNPLMSVADLDFLSALAQAHDVILAVDNTLCTPVFQNPIRHGADLTLHSAGKYIDGQGRCGGGVILGRASLIGKIRRALRTFGPSLSPFNAWVFVKGLETLAIRMRVHQSNTEALARWLSEQGLVERIYYTGDPRHPQAALIARQQSGHGGLLSFVLRGGREEAWAVMNRLRFINLTTNIGDTKTMITHPATTTHALTTQKERDEVGITDGLLRISVGLEDIGDIIADLDHALQPCAAAASV